MDTYDQKQKENIVTSWWKDEKAQCPDPDCGYWVKCRKESGNVSQRWLLVCTCERCGKSFTWTPEEDDALRLKQSKSRQSGKEKAKKIKPKEIRYI